MSMPRTERSKAYANHLAGVRALRHSKAADDIEVVKSINGTLKRMREDGEMYGAVRATGSADVHVNTLMGNMSVAYANDMFIGDRLMPVLPVNKLSNLFAKYSKRDILGYPDDEMGEGSEAAEVSQSKSTGTYLVKPKGFKTKVLVKTLDNQDEPYDEMVDANDQVAEGLSFKREKRIAGILSTAANYNGNTSALGASARWDVGTGTPIKTIIDAKANTWMGRGRSKLVGFCSQTVYNALRVNASILETLKYTRGGIAKYEELCNLFELDELLVGASRQDTANSGQAESISRIWPDVFGIVRVAENPSLRNAVFGYTPRFKNEIITKTWYDPKTDSRGAYWIQQTTDEDHIIVAPETGFLLTTVIG